MRTQTEKLGYELAKEIIRQADRGFEVGDLGEELARRIVAEIEGE